MAADSRDFYRVLGVARDASREEIALAWRRRARDEHPDARHGDAAAPARFRAVAEAWQVLGDPDRRAAYDRQLGSGQPAARVRVTVRRPPAPSGPGAGDGMGQPAGVPGPPLVAGPVKVDTGRGPAPWQGDRYADDLRLALLAELVLCYRRRGRPW